MQDNPEKLGDKEFLAKTNEKMLENVSFLVVTREGEVYFNGSESLPYRYLRELLEIEGESSRFVRTNQSYRDFAKEILRIKVPEAECLPCTSDEYPSRTPRPKYSALDHVMLRATCGDEMRDWKDALYDNLKDLDV